MREQFAEQDRSYLDNVVIPDRPLTLEDVVAIGSELSLDLLVKKQAWAIQREVTSREMWKMIPSLNITGELSHRNKAALTRSLSFFPVRSWSRPSVDTSQTTMITDILLTWNLLDFGVNFYQSQQEQYKAFISYFQYVRAGQTLVLDLYKAYWKAIVAKKARDAAREVWSLATKLQTVLEKERKERWLSAQQALRVEDQMLTIQLRLYNYENIYQSAKMELAGLMGLPPEICFELADIEFIPSCDHYNVRELEEIALNSRPELYGADSDNVVAINEVRAAFVQFFPGLELFSGTHEDADKFLVNHLWVHAGLRTAWNLLSIPGHAADKKAAEARVVLTEETRVGLSLAILTQVNIAYIQYIQVMEQYSLQQEQAQIRDKALYATQKGYDYGEQTILDLLSAQNDALAGMVDTWQAYASMQVALEQVNNSIGQPLLLGNPHVYN